MFQQGPRGGDGASAQAGRGSAPAPHARRTWGSLTRLPTCHFLAEEPWRFPSSPRSRTASSLCARSLEEHLSPPLQASPAASTCTRGWHATQPWHQSEGSVLLISAKRNSGSYKNVYKATDYNQSWRKSTQRKTKVRKSPPDSSVPPRIPRGPQSCMWAGGGHTPGFHLASSQSRKRKQGWPGCSRPQHETRPDAFSGECSHSGESVPLKSHPEGTLL